MVQLINTEKMLNNDGTPVVSGEILSYTEIHAVAEVGSYKNIGRLVRVKEIDTLLSEYMLFVQALRETYQSPIMEQIRIQEWKTLAEIGQSFEPSDPSKHVIIYCPKKVSKDSIERFIGIRTGKWNCAFTLESISKGYFLLDARSPTRSQEEMFAQGLEQKIKEMGK